jgi:microcystin-dependent protein
MEYEIGTIIQFAYNWESDGWEACDGRRLPIKQYPELYDVIGCGFGGDFKTYFNLPDLRPRDTDGNLLKTPYAEKINGVHHIPHQIRIIGKKPSI